MKKIWISLITIGVIAFIYAEFNDYFDKKKKKNEEKNIAIFERNKYVIDSTRAMIVEKNVTALYKIEARIDTIILNYSTDFEEYQNKNILVPFRKQNLIDSYRGDNGKIYIKLIIGGDDWKNQWHQIFLEFKSDTSFPYEEMNLPNPFNLEICIENHNLKELLKSKYLIVSINNLIKKGEFSYEEDADKVKNYFIAKGKLIKIIS
jgi:hypothetical protein